MNNRNLYGKITCALGVPAFILCLLAEHSQQYRVADKANPLLSLAVNWLLAPVNYIKGVTAKEEIYIGPEMKSLGLDHVFEHEAIVMFFVVGFLLGTSALYLVAKAAKRSENTIWYTNGAFTSLSALFLINGYLGMLVTVITLGVVFRARGDI